MDDNLDDSVVSEEYQGDTIKKLREKLKESEGKAKDYLDSWQRAQADFVNLRKRDEEARMDFLKFAKADVLAELIPILDSFSQAISHGHNDVLPIQKQMLGILKQHGLEEQDPLGEIFNPALHEAVGMVATDNKDDDHKILEVLAKGYIMMGKVIRAAKVRVGELSK